MRDIDVFTQLLALERPWSVDEVIFDAKDESIGVFLRHRSNARFRCPSCGVFLPLYDHTPLRQWRHLDHGSWLTWLHARLPRVSCSIHGVQRVRVPWALPGSRFTIDFEKHAIDTLLEADTLGASRLLQLSWDETWGVMERAVARGMKAKRRRVIPYLGVDEKSIAKRHRYVTLVSDLDLGTVEFISFDRKKAVWTPSIRVSLRGNWGAFEPSPWTCGIRSSARLGSTFPTPRTRSSSTASTS